MGKALVIVESPAKAKTINKYLGNDYVVKSSVGHIRDLPTSGSASKKSANSAEEKAKKTINPKESEERRKGCLSQPYGVDPYHGWKAQYEICLAKRKWLPS